MQLYAHIYNFTAFKIFIYASSYLFVIEFPLGAEVFR